MDICIKATQVTKRFKSHTAVQQLSLSVKKGEVFGILGHNGAGKTTTIEMLLGLQKPDEGKITLLGHPMEKKDKALFERIGVQLQSTSYQNNIRVNELCEEMSALYQNPANYKDLLQAFGLTPQAHQMVEKLSGGERQKLSILLALLPQPEILFLDELTTGLDTAARRGIWESLKAWKEKGVTIVLTTHYMEEAAYLCDHILILKQGRAIKEGTVEEVIGNYENLEEAFLHYMEEETI